MYSFLVRFCLLENLAEILIFAQCNFLAFLLCWVNFVILGA